MNSFALDERNVLISPVCDDCKYADYLGARKCAAFPDGIPLDIWCGKIKHNEHIDGDNGIVFSLMTEDDLKARREARIAALPAIEAELERKHPGQLQMLYDMLDGKIE